MNKTNHSHSTSSCEGLEALHLSPYLFWDVDSEQLDPRQHASFIIRRVMERGDLDDVRAAWRHFGSAAVREAMLTARCADRRTLAFFANQFGVERSAFRAALGVAAR